MYSERQVSTRVQYPVTSTLCGEWTGEGEAGPKRGVRDVHPRSSRRRRPGHVSTRILCDSIEPRISKDAHESASAQHSGVALSRLQGSGPGGSLKAPGVRLWGIVHAFIWGDHLRSEDPEIPGARGWQVGRARSSSPKNRKIEFWDMKMIEISEILQDMIFSFFEIFWAPESVFEILEIWILEIWVTEIWRPGPGGSERGSVGR